ncbi:hypothetical protein EI555_007334 [Monodon monoceros]|uniref:Uncharacterized protein n=1 Tax=Monodon monoceros TaxID=40151 RepID=A0A4U1F2M6_MONMO|nr:hypothetical protein EI555_007334 [Monodon monoceros]
MSLPTRYCAKTTVDWMPDIWKLIYGVFITIVLATPEKLKIRILINTTTTTNITELLEVAIRITTARLRAVAGYMVHVPPAASVVIAVPVTYSLSRRVAMPSQAPQRIQAKFCWLLTYLTPMQLCLGSVTPILGTVHKLAENLHDFPYMDTVALFSSIDSSKDANLQQMIEYAFWFGENGTNLIRMVLDQVSGTKILFTKMIPKSSTTVMTIIQILELDALFLAIKENIKDGFRNNYNDNANENNDDENMMILMPRFPWKCGLFCHLGLERMTHMVYDKVLSANMIQDEGQDDLQDILAHPCVISLDSAILISSSTDATDDSTFNRPYKFPAPKYANRTMEKTVHLSLKDKKFQYEIDDFQVPQVFEAIHFDDLDLVLMEVQQPGVGGDAIWNLTKNAREKNDTDTLDGRTTGHDKGGSYKIPCMTAEIPTPITSWASLIAHHFVQNSINISSIVLHTDHSNIQMGIQVVKNKQKNA